MKRSALIASGAVLLLLVVLPVCASGDPETEAVALAASQEEEAEPEYRCSYKLEDCLNWMAKHYGERGWAGMNLDVEGYSYTVREVLGGSPAEMAGIRPGDRLVAVNGVEIAEKNQEKLLKIRDKMKPGVQFTYTVKRQGKRRNVECKLVEMPLESAAEQIGRHLLVGHLEPHLAFEESDSE